MVYNALQLTLINMKLCDLYELHKVEYNMQIRNLKK